ncbi:CCC motif membrane protein [Nonlabens sp.]|uniref:CCC motif membrane protein n=1 Tax=Nonlabens sp. TaxID=1888209 RepID=UPI003F6A30EC
MQKLNTTLVYILSIIGFICCCFGIGWIPSLIGLLVANSELKKGKNNTDLYVNINAMKSAKVVAIIALAISLLLGLFIIYIIYMVYNSPEFACEFWTKMVEGMQDNPSVTSEQLEMYIELRDKACSKA